LPKLTLSTKAWPNISNIIAMSYMFADSVCVNPSLAGVIPATSQMCVTFILRETESLEGWDTSSVVYTRTSSVLHLLENNSSLISIFSPLLGLGCFQLSTDTPMINSTGRGQ
jgi:hypothetical protein